MILLRLLLRSARPYRRWLLGVLLLQTVLAAASLALPALNAAIINRGVLQQDTGAIGELGLLMLGATVLEGLVAVGAVYCSSRVGLGVGRDLRAGVFDRAVRFSTQQVDRMTPGSLITRATNDVQQLQQLVLGVCNVLLLAPLTVVGAMVLAARQDAGMVWVVALVLPAMGIPLALVVRSMGPASVLLQDRTDRVNGLVREQVMGLRVVKAFSREDQERERFALVNTQLGGALVVNARRSATMMPIMMVVINLSSVLVLLVGAGRVQSGALSVGALVAFLGYLALALMSVIMSTFVVMQLPRATVCARRLQEVLDLPPAVVPPAAPRPTPSPVGALTFSGVRFQYPGADAPVFRDVTFTARRGRTTAVVGSTGVGKTTLLNLVPRLLDPTEGAVLVDGTDVRETDPHELRQHLGLVPQRPFLFSGTIASNLRLGRPDASAEELWQALAAAQAEEFVRGLPDGLEAPVSQGGTNFSGGQRQRLSIARALVRRPDVYLFDDCFSALDLATETRLREALVPWTEQAVVLVVAQRVATFEAADQVVVLDDGRVVGVGTHDELLGSCPTYVEIVASQPRDQVLR